MNIISCLLFVVVLAFVIEILVARFLLVKLDGEKKNRISERFQDNEMSKSVSEMLLGSQNICNFDYDY